MWANILQRMTQGTLPLCLKRLTHSFPEVGLSRRYLQDNVFHCGGSVCEEPTCNSVDPSSIRVRKITWRSPWSSKESHHRSTQAPQWCNSFPLSVSDSGSCDSWFISLVHQMNLSGSAFYWSASVPNVEIYFPLFLFGKCLLYICRLRNIGPQT